MSEPREKATCRGCGRELWGEAFLYGGRAYHPETGHECPENYYGGFVCSRRCDAKASLEFEQSMPGHGLGQTRIGPDARRCLEGNWPNAQP